MAQVVLKDLNKKFDENHVVKDVNLHVRDKEFVVLVGPSGGGKSTTPRMAGGTAGEGATPPPGHRGPPKAEAPAALGRPAPARGGRPRHRPPPPGLPFRRAALEPGRQAPRPDAGGAEAPSRPACDDRHLRHSRPGPSHDPGQPGGGDEG